MGFHDLHKQQVWPNSGILKPRKGPDVVPEILGSRKEKVPVKHWDLYQSRGTNIYFPAVDFHSCRKVF